MKTIIKNLVLATASLLLVTSCVSSKKYSAIMEESKKYKEQLASMESNNKDLQSSNNDLTNKLATTNDQLKEKQKELDDKYMQLTQDQKTLNELQKAVRLEQNEISGIRQEVCDALKCFTPDELSVKEKDGELYVSMYDKLLFPSGSAAVNTRGNEALKMLSDVLVKDNMKIMVEGHTDNVPIYNSRYKDNWDLSVDRATNVTRILIKDKIAPERIIASGKSKYDPFDSNSTEKGRQFNRRTDIVLVPKLENLYSLINQGNNLNLTPVSINTSPTNKTSATLNRPIKNVRK